RHIVTAFVRGRPRRCPEPPRDVALPARRGRREPVRTVGRRDRRDDAGELAAERRVTAPADRDVVRDPERSERPNVPWLDVDLTANEIYRYGVPYGLFRTFRAQHPVWRHPTVPTNRSPDGIGFWAVLGHPE